ncbi:hypothetical protein [uncultured Parabacteroides sp.]|jgi:hypothetical protein|uniref:hypothetical protein n=2 Tax=Parabacteroides TaxID=375288 RepID=UPI002600A59C|nr:hypothetical protein [uncultured Parabacteroides sp.]
MKKGKIISSLVFVLGCYFTSHAQTYEHFDLSSFITPDIVRNELDFSLNSSGLIQDNKGSSQDHSSLGGDFGTAFNRIKNTRPYWGKQEGRINLNGKYARDKSNDYKANEYQTSFSYYTDNRFYKTNKRFWSLSGNLFGYVNGNKQDQPSYQKYKSKYFSGDVSLGIGKGRIESVTDARQAIYILDNLSKKGVLKRQLTNNEILELSKLIAIVKNKRFFDSRLRMIDEVSAVDSFFVTNRLLESSGASYFTTLYDYWMYGDRFERGAGLVFSGSILGGYGHTRSDNIRENNNDNSGSKSTIPFAGALFTMEYEKPVNLYWQQSASLSLRGQYERTSSNDPYIENDPHLKLNQYSTQFSGSYNWGYYPNSRTNLNWGIREFLYWRDIDYMNTKQTSNNNYWNTSTELYFKTYYYFSPQIRLSADVRGGLEYIKYKHWDTGQLGWNGSFQLTFTYSLF